MVCSSSICLLLPQWFIFPTRRKTKGSLIYFWKCSKKSVHLIKHIVVWRYNAKEVLDDAHIKVHFQRICRQGNPRTWHSDWHGSTNREYPIPYTCMMTTWVSCYSDNGKPRLKRCNLQAKWLCDTLLYLLILDVRINIGDYTKWQYLGQHPWRWVLIGICLFEMVDEILFCMVQFIFYKTYRAIELGRIWEIVGISHPKRVTCHFRPKIHDSATHSDLYLFNFIECI